MRDWWHGAFLWQRNASPLSSVHMLQLLMPSITSKMISTELLMPSYRKLRLQTGSYSWVISMLEWVRSTWHGVKSSASMVWGKWTKWAQTPLPLCRAPLVITNTIFQMKNRFKTTWQHPRFKTLASPWLRDCPSKGQTRCPHHPCYERSRVLDWPPHGQIQSTHENSTP